MAITSKLTGISATTLALLTALSEQIMSDPAITAVIPKVDAEGTETGDFDARVNTSNLEALLELLNNEKKAAKSVDESLAVADKEKAKAEAAIAGAEKAKKVKVGDIVVFTMGSGKGKKTFTRTVEKMSDKTFTVSFDESYPCTTSVSTPTGKKHIKFASIVSFSTPVAETVAETVAEAVAV